jgi:ABC-type transport system substrate-binding protein
MSRQVSAVKFEERKRLYDRVQELMADNLPLIYLASPDIVVGAKVGLGNFGPALLESYALWNVEQLYWSTEGARLRVQP